MEVTRPSVAKRGDRAETADAFSRHFSTGQISRARATIRPRQNKLNAEGSLSSGSESEALTSAKLLRTFDDRGPFGDGWHDPPRGVVLGDEAATWRPR